MNSPYLVSVGYVGGGCRKEKGTRLTKTAKSHDRITASDRLRHVHAVADFFFVSNITNLVVHVAFASSRVIVVAEIPPLVAVSRAAVVGVGVSSSLQPPSLPSFGVGFAAGASGARGRLQLPLAEVGHRVRDAFVLGPAGAAAFATAGPGDGASRQREALFLDLPQQSRPHSAIQGVADQSGVRHMSAANQLAADRLHGGATFVVQLPDDVGHSRCRQGRPWTSLASRRLRLFFRSFASGFVGADVGPFST